LICDSSATQLHDRKPQSTIEPCSADQYPNRKRQRPKVARYDHQWQSTKQMRDKDFCAPPRVTRHGKAHIGKPKPDRRSLTQAKTDQDRNTTPGHDLKIPKGM